MFQTQQGMPLVDSIETVDNISVQIKRLTGTHEKNIYTKMENVYKYGSRYA
jgi:hypothetical protein